MSKLIRRDPPLSVRAQNAAILERSKHFREVARAGRGHTVGSPSARLISEYNSLAEAARMFGR